MLILLDRKISLNQIIWAFPILLFLHDAEEIFTMEQFTHTRHFYPEFVQSTTAQFSISIAMIWVLTLCISYFATQSPQSTIAVWLFGLMVAVRFVNVFSHIGSTLLLREYTPGVITAVFIALPCSLYALRRLFQLHWLSWNRLAQLLALGIILMVPLVLVLLALGKFIGTSMGI